VNVFLGHLIEPEIMKSEIRFPTTEFLQISSASLPTILVAADIQLYTRVLMLCGCRCGQFSTPPKTGHFNIIWAAVT